MFPQNALWTRAHCRGCLAAGEVINTRTSVGQGRQGQDDGTYWCPQAWHQIPCSRGRGYPAAAAPGQCTQAHQRYSHCMLISMQASLLGSLVPLTSTLEGDTLQAFASIMLGTARTSLFHSHCWISPDLHEQPCSIITVFKQCPILVKSSYIQKLANACHREHLCQNGS